LCRGVLAEVPQDEEDDEDDYDDDEEFEEDFALRGSRWLFMRAEGEPIDEEDTDDETLSDSSDDDNYVRYVSEETPIVPIAEVCEKIRQRGVTYEQLVALLILPDSRCAADLALYTHRSMSDLDEIFCEIVNGNSNA
jgi:hypothetical protein